MSTTPKYPPIAHSANSNGIEQSLAEHSSGVAKLMCSFSLNEKFKEIYSFCGYVHDLGKYSNQFQKYIKQELEPGKKVPHAIWGALYCFQQNLVDVFLPVYGHHAGLPDIFDAKIATDEKLSECKEMNTFNEILKNWEKDLSHIKTPVNDYYRSLPKTQKDLYVRMLFSSLVDADWLDTERHFDIKKYASRPKLKLDSKLLLQKLHKTMSGFKQDTRINVLRNSVQKYAESMADSPLGFYSLTLPTGMGKTLCSINWALRHSMTNPNINRIIIVLPFISIIDQTANTLKEIFGEDQVLEHHSNVLYETGQNFKKKIATENWDYPIVITTAVQFFETLFSNKSSKCRKLHNIQNSIIIFDEIQSLPTELAEPTITMLNDLQQLFRCSLLFCTATQPDFSKRKGFNGIDNIVSLVESPQKIFNETQRVEYVSFNSYNPVALDDIAKSAINNNQSALVVFNTKKKARLFFERAQYSDGFMVFHLSTTMCPTHRKETIKKIKAALNSGQKIIVSATQLIEAGVDLDFPSVYREVAPLESIIQAAGRCNRNGKMKDEHNNPILGKVFLFTLDDSAQPSPQYRSLAEFANLLYAGKENKLHTCDFYADYYRKITENYVDPDKYKITKDRETFKFKTVADKYRIIDNDTTTLFVFKYDDSNDIIGNSHILYNQIKDKDFIDSVEMRQVAQYSVQVYDKFLSDNSQFISYEKCGVAVWHGSYDSNMGIPFIEDQKNIIL